MGRLPKFESGPYRWQLSTEREHAESLFNANISTADVNTKFQILIKEMVKSLETPEEQLVQEFQGLEKLKDETSVKLVHVREKLKQIQTSKQKKMQDEQENKLNQAYALEKMLKALLSTRKKVFTHVKPGDHIFEFDNEHKNALKNFLADNAFSVGIEHILYIFSSKKFPKYEKEQSPEIKKLVGQIIAGGELHES